jgi:mevalonate kinase
MSNQFYSHGKLLITGEYFVLEGSAAFALPLKLGQRMVVSTVNDSKRELTWDTYVKSKPTFRAVYNMESLEIKSTNNSGIATNVQKLLMWVQGNSNVLNDTSISLKITTSLEFPFEWGLGSSSSLVSNLAYWSNTNPYQLLFDTSQGSGYDIACARSIGPVIYQLNQNPISKGVEFAPPFLENLFFIYLGQKQNSLSSVQQYREVILKNKEEALQITRITNSIIHSKTLNEFEEYITLHESIVSRVLQRPTVKEQYFGDYDGCIKSLGAWGGDFILATSHFNYDYVTRYFNAKGLHIMFPYNELVL